MNLIKLTAASGQDVFVNPNNIVSVYQVNGKTRVFTTQRHDQLPEFLPVRETPQAVADIVARATASAQAPTTKKKLFGLISL